MKAIIHTSTYDFRTYAENQYVLFDKQIIETGPMTAFIDKGYEVIDGKDCLTMPSLVNGHGHIYSTFARGMSVPFTPVNFLEILEQLWWKLDGHLLLEDVYYSGVVYSRDTLLNGVTTIIDHHASGTVKGSLNQLKKAVVDEGGMRGIFCFETSDRFDTDSCIAENLDFAKENHTDTCTGLFGLHASMTLSNATLKRISEVIGTLPIHIHVAESKYEASACVLKYGKNILQRLDAFNLLTDRSLLAHCLYIDAAEAVLIKKRGCKVVFNVTSNMNNGVGLPDHKKLRQMAIPLMVGNDGISSGIFTEYLNLYYAMHLQYQSPVSVPLTDILKMIDDTYTYAGDLLGINIGRIEAGYESDLLMVPYLPPTPINSGNAFGHLFYGLGNSFRPKHVWCAGQQLVEDFEVKEQHLENYKKAKAVAAKLWQRISEGGDQ